MDDPAGGNGVVNFELRDKIQDLLTEYVGRIDNDELESWLDLFLEDASYRIVPRENVEQELPGAIMLCENKNMIRDRVALLRKANKYNIHTDRHMISAVRIREAGDGEWAVETNYAVFQTDQEGVSQLFSVGVYRDRVVVVDGVARFKEKLVIVDTYGIPSLLAVPL